ncbi:unnamed protein product [Arctia plantaginis]|uniref:Uncharacterized protein n=1 Tax=Arctia plantaginis TaxID=874455 RepID=A0A8S0ZRV4_ARCPL|nr:unnamed protein product [Arctia plantaginis]CAB3235864.1 unnamed protein product [Arctia plantaginis]
MRNIPFPFKTGVHFLGITTNVEAEGARSLYEFFYCVTMRFYQSNKSSAIPVFIKDKSRQSHLFKPCGALLKIDIFVKKHNTVLLSLHLLP